jgi:transposase
MLVQPGFGGTRQGYAKSKGSGIKLSAAQIKKLRENLSAEDFNKLDFNRTGVQSGQINYGVGQRDNKPLYRKVLNILEPGKASSGVKIINNEKLSNALIKSANAGDNIQTIIKKMNKLDKSLSRNQISSAINALVARGNISKEFGRVAGKDLSIGEQKKYNKIIEKEVKSGKLNRAQIAKKAGVSDSVVQDWIVNNKGQDFYDENYTYEKGRLKTGTLQKQKDLFNYIETVDNISAAEIKKVFNMKSGKETQKLMSDLLGAIYRMRGIRGTKEGSLIVPYDDETRMKEVVNKIRNAPDFEDIYQRRIGDLITEAYPKGPKRNQAIKSLGEYYKFSRALKEVAPELALSLDHVVPFQFLEEVKQGANPMNLIKVKPIPQAVNRFKANFDAARIELNRQLKIDPTNKNTLNKFKLLRELEKITPIEFGGVSAKGNVYDFKAKPIGQSNLIEDAIEGLRTYNRIGKFSQQVLGDEALQKKLIKAGVETGKDFAAFKKITPLSQAKQNEVINTVVSYSKLKKCQISLNADGGRIGFANSVECITDGLNEAKKAAASGDKKAARQLVETAEAASKGGRLLKNVLGPGALLGEAVFEGAIIGNKVLGGKPLKQAWAESFLSYLDPRKYRGELDPLLLERDRMLEQSGYKDVLRSGFAAQDQLSAANEAVEKRNIASARNRLDQYLPAAADAREQAARAGLSTKIISDEAFKDAVNLAQESIQGLEGNQRFKYGILSTPQGEGADSMRRQIADTAMKNLYTQYTDQEMRDMLGPEKFKRLSDQRITKRIVPSIAPTISGLDYLRSLTQEKEAMDRIADAGGVANLAGGGIAKEAGDPSGAMLQSMNPDSQGLRGLLKRGKKI